MYGYKWIVGDVGQQHQTLYLTKGHRQQLHRYSADIFTCGRIWLFDTAYISPWYLVSLADSIFCCCAWMILQRQGSQDPTARLPLLTGRPRLRMRPGGRKKERQDGAQVGAFSHLESQKKIAMVKTQVPWQAKWVSLFLSFSCESRRTLWQHTAEYLSYSVYHS